MNHSKFSAPKDRKKECGLDWHVAINKQPTAPIRAPVYSVYGFAKQTMAACRRIFSFSSPPPALFLTRRPLPWNHFLARPKPLSVLSSKMAAEHSKDYLSLARPNTPALQAKNTRVFCRVKNNDFLSLKTVSDCQKMKTSANR